MIRTIGMRISIVKKSIVSFCKGLDGWDRWIVTFVLAGLVSLSTSMEASARWGAPVSFGEGTLNNPLGVGVDQTAGSTYVSNFVEVGNDKFDTSHQLVSPPSP